MHPGPVVLGGSATAMGDGYQRIPGIQLPGEHDHYILGVESVAGFVAPALIGVSAQFAGP